MIPLPQIKTTERGLRNRSSVNAWFQGKCPFDFESSQTYLHPLLNQRSQLCDPLHSLASTLAPYV